MHKPNILWLANWIEDCDQAFNMESAVVRPESRSAGCIGAHAAALWNDIRSASKDAPGGCYTWDNPKLAKRLGVSKDFLSTIVFPIPKENGDFLSVQVITKNMAVAGLRRLAETGRVCYLVADNT